MSKKLKVCKHELPPPWTASHLACPDTVIPKNTIMIICIVDLIQMLNFVPQGIPWNKCVNLWIQKLFCDLPMMSIRRRRNIVTIMFPSSNYMHGRVADEPKCNSCTCNLLAVASWITRKWYPERIVHRNGRANLSTRVTSMCDGYENAPDPLVERNHTALRWTLSLTESVPAKHCSYWAAHA